MFKNRKKQFIGFATPKIVEFSILYLHFNVYILLSSKKVITLFFNCDGGHIGLKGLDDLKCKKWDLSRQK